MLDPDEVALAFDRFVSARWRGAAAEADPLAAWFEAHWTGEAPPEPDDFPDAVSVLDGAGGGIRWYVRGGAILGYVAGRSRGCYWVPDDGAPPPISHPASITRTAQPGIEG